MSFNEKRLINLPSSYKSQKTCIVLFILFIWIGFTMIYMLRVSYLILISNYAYLLYSLCTPKIRDRMNWHVGLKYNRLWLDVLLEDIVFRILDCIKLQLISSKNLLTLWNGNGACQKHRLLVIKVQTGNSMVRGITLGMRYGGQD